MNATAEAVQREVKENSRLNIARLAGTLIGGAVGDALGLPMEGLSARRQKRLFPGPLRHRLVGPFGMISDDTEHTIMVAQSLLESPREPDEFQRRFAWKLRWWLAGAPAGVGFATLRAILKLWAGFPRRSCGVYSAGNGPAMRSAVLGVYFAEEPELRRQFVHASTQLTHHDPRARIAAEAVAETASQMAKGWDGETDLFTTLQSLSKDTEWLSLSSRLHAAFHEGASVSAFAQSIGAPHGVSGYAYQTVPVAIYAALVHRDNFAEALSAAISCGGDTDTVGSIVGALVGCRVGVAGIPKDWRTGILDWPRTLGLLEKIAARLDRQKSCSTALEPVSYFWPAIPIRNLAFLAVVLAHGFRRILPPF